MFDTSFLEDAASCLDMGSRDPKGPESEEAKRMRRLREIIAGDNQSKFASDLGISVSRWNNIERGTPIGKEVAFLLVRKYPDLTTDWIFFGNPRGLTVKWLNLLEGGGVTKRKGRY